MMHEFDHLLHYIKPLLPLSTTVNPAGEIKGSIRCLLFDIYGTLFISGSGDISIARRQSRQTRYLENLMDKYHIKKGPHTVLNPVYPMPNLEQILSACRQSDVLTGIISNAQFFTPYLFHWFFDSSPEDLGFNRDLIFYSYKTGFAKPSPVMFERAAENLKHMDIFANSALYIGNDMLNDIFPAQKTGFKTALFAGDARSLRLRENHPDCKNLSPDIVVTDLVQLLKYV
jgi:hypothetical protein